MYRESQEACPAKEKRERGRERERDSENRNWTSRTQNELNK